MKSPTSLAALAALLAPLATAISLSVASVGGNASSPLMYGIMFEDINHSGDGGIYAELIRNRAFQGNSSTVTIDPWVAFPSNSSSTLTLQSLSTPLSAALPVSLNVAAAAANTTVGIANPGYWGIDILVQPYTGSFWTHGAFSGNITASLQSTTVGTTWASTDIEVASESDVWTKWNFTLTPTAAAGDVNNTFALSWTANEAGESLDLNLISLFPPTYKRRENGMRVDLMESLKGLNPSFLRMPGGNNLEGNYEGSYWNWTDTIGPLEDRPGYAGTWGYENTLGLGLAEYLNWCVDLEMEPILAVWAGLYLDGAVVAEADFDPVIQNTLNELEYVLGDTSTTYGALRASHGYPDPWEVNYIEVGNEDHLNGGLDSYTAYRFQLLYDPIIAAYPSMNIYASTIESPTKPGNSGGDYHQYTRPDYFVSQFNFFDNGYNDTNKVLIGEYAVVQPNTPDLEGVDWDDARSVYPFWIGTVSEAVFLIGMERNGENMLGASYAPLLQNMNSYEWSPDLISFDASTVTESTSYYQIQLFSANRISETLPVTSDTGFDPAYWVAGINNSTGSFILKVAVYNTTDSVPFSVAFDGVEEGASATLTTLTAPDPYTSNALGSSNAVVTNVTTLTAGSGGALSFSLPEWSIAVLTT